MMKVFGLDYGGSWFSSCKKALENSGHEVRGARALFNDDQTLKGEKGIIEDIRTFRPDFVLIYNLLDDAQADSGSCRLGCKIQVEYFSLNFRRNTRPVITDADL